MALYQYQATLSATSSGTEIPIATAMAGCAGGIVLVYCDTAGSDVRINPPGQTITSDNGLLLTADVCNGPFVFQIDSDTAADRPHLYAGSATDVNVQVRRLARGESA